MSYKMPRTPIDYSRTIIYKLVCNDLKIKECYVGATTCFTKRKTQHKSDCYNEKTNNYNCNVYQFIRVNGGWDNWNMIMVEEYPCKNKLESDKRERHWIESLKAELNNCVPSRNLKEYYQDNKEKHKEYYQEYYQENKEKITEGNNKYYTKNKEKISENRKEYRKNNKEKLAKRRAEYYQEQKAKTNALIAESV
jgi:hypothetical protein